MRLFFSAIAIFVLVCSFQVSAQDNVRIGVDGKSLIQTNGAFYDYSLPNTVNIKVSVWGFVRNPGYYMVPESTTFFELLSYAGGPTNDAYMNDIRVYRTNSNNAQEVLELDYRPMLFENKEGKAIVTPPTIQPGDIIVLPGEPRLYFRDYLTITLSIVSTLISLAILIINIAK
ncbi:hypothetical protein DOJK_02382 [Patescibacteria group bacterium]|nr:hypothetical protein DOJK_02382 [Patescibacteria group bacterium]